MWSKFRLNKQKASAEREEERRVIIIKEITQIEQIINLIQKEKKNEKDEELKEKLESKIHELEKRKKELLRINQCSFQLRIVVVGKAILD